MLKPVKGTERIFKIAKKRIETGVSEKNVSGKTFKIEDDLEKTRQNFEEFIESLPAKSMILLISGHKKNGCKTIEILKSDVTIRTYFVKTKVDLWFTKLTDFLKKDFKYIQFQVANLEEEKGF